MKAVLAILLFANLLLAGCSGGDPAAPVDASEDFEDLGVAPTATTGVILGVVVDASISPIAEATIQVNGADGTKTATSDAEGRFAVGDLQPGTYLLQVTHLLYLPAQTSVEVV